MNRIWTFTTILLVSVALLAVAADNQHVAQLRTQLATTQDQRDHALSALAQVKASLDAITAASQALHVGTQRLIERDAALTAVCDATAAQRDQLVTQLHQLERAHTQFVRCVSTTEQRLLDATQIPRLSDGAVRCNAAGVCF